MNELFKKYDIELEENELEKFEKFLEVFISKNSEINLSAIREKDAIIEKHFIDSIMLNIFIELEWKVADIWTWWGFPLIPLAITNPNVQFVWVDSVWKKIKVVDEFAKELNLKNIKTVTWRMEDIWKDVDFREQFDFVVSRATAYLPTLLEYAIPLLKVWWLFIAYKLDDKEELTSAKKALTKLNSKILKIKNYKIWEQERTFIFIEKKEKTDPKYPRANWVPLQKPIK